MREYMKEELMRSLEKLRMVTCCKAAALIISKTTRNKKNQAAGKRKLNLEHVREIEGHSFRK